ncbi:MAG: 30S ribosomal protein S17 [Planctomycetota bacterium]|nr:30S ribosomal protein S17 [Planctomycetota bacterium]MCZ6493831.1 30S ribosomal protein S17 [Planctomycetota bacterium]MCZ6543871.1 30S ribosomal protein S17 [Planctomycetota bacterium]MCZ6736120.1 30S ribosomal protein S17 [Planctomycetota bacterium]MCZ6812394.1 30S ribosomal protein S17 [Planctomycetota bacterium]
MGHLKEIKIPQRSPRRVGVVESDAREKTRKVAIHYTVRHPKYGKYIRRRTMLHVHDEANVSKKGDRVEIAECRPISKEKSWVLVRVVKSASDSSSAALPDAAEALRTVIPSEAKDS